MFCPKCARNNPDQNKFCNGCGASLQVQIPSPPAAIAPPPPPPVQIRIVQDNAHSKLAEIEVRSKKDISDSSDINVRKTEGETEKLQQTSGEKTSLDATLPKISEDAESLLDGALTSGHNAEPKEKIINVLQSKTNTEANPTFSEKMPDYLSEIENKYRKFPVQHTANSKSAIYIVAGGALAAIVIFGGFFWYFFDRNNVSEEKAANKNTILAKNSPVVETSKTNQPPTNMVFVPGGEFMMGSNGGDEFSRPAHRVSVKPFYIDSWEVTCEEYKQFIDATRHAAPPSWSGNDFPSGAARKPVTGVNWDDAAAFAKWKNKRLLTEEEWEFAARGTDGRIYPWGNDWNPEMANADKQKNGVQEIGLSKGASPFGVFDLSGNAWEWTASDARSYPNGKSFETNSSDPKVIRGGFFGSSKDKATAIFRRAWGARSETDYGNTGFRCAADLSVK